MTSILLQLTVFLRKLYLYLEATVPLTIESWMVLTDQPGLLYCLGCGVKIQNALQLSVSWKNSTLFVYSDLPIIEKKPLVVTLNYNELLKCSFYLVTLKVALQIMGRKFYKNTKKSSLCSHSLYFLFTKPQ